MRALFRFLALLSALVLSTGALAQTVQTPAEALARDAAEIARQSGATPDEALRDLLAQEESVTSTDALAREFSDRLAGIAVDHRPFRITVLLTDDVRVDDRVLALGGSEVPVHFVTGARVTRAAALEVLRLHQKAIRASLTLPPSIGFDPRTGELVVLAHRVDIAREGAGPLRDRLAQLTAVPLRIEQLEQPVGNMGIEGGGRIEGPGPDGRRYVCTTGFAVTDGARDAMTTAAHCPDQVDYVEPGQPPIALPYIDQRGWGYQDVQLNLAPQPLPPRFHPDSAKAISSPVVTWRPRASTRAGDIVCHRGEQSGYSCAEVQMTDFAPAGDLCGGDCLASWVKVAGPSCKGGDSGGPVFLGATAIGIVKGGSYQPGGTCDFYFYMSVDYLPEGWRLKLDRPLPSVQPLENDAAPGGIGSGQPDAERVAR